MKLIKFVNREKKHAYYMLEETINGKQYRFLVNFPSNRNRAILALIEETRYIEKADNKEEK